MRFDGNGGGAVNYEPNSFGGPTEDPRFKEPPLKISGDADRYDHRDGNDDYTQAGNLYRLFTPAEKRASAPQYAGAMSGVPKEIIDRQLAHFERPIRPMPPECVMRCRPKPRHAKPRRRSRRWPNDYRTTTSHHPQVMMNTYEQAPFTRSLLSIYHMTNSSSTSRTFKLRVGRD